MDEAQVRLRLADGLLQIDPLLLKRPEGEAELRYRLNLLTQDFRWTVSRCRMLPKAVAPAVAEVGVVGVPDEMRGESVRACISLKTGEVATEEELRRFCRKHMADYKLPKQIILLDSLPKTAAGQIRKEDLKTSPPQFPSSPEA